MSGQTAFAQALLDPTLPCPPGFQTWNGSDPQTRFAVYRNNVTVSLIDALAQTFPVVQSLVGEEFFSAMAKVFVQRNPPRSRLMAFYGDGFPTFISGFAPASGLPYLADVARLEMARVQAYHAADLEPVEPSALAAAMADGDKLMSLQLHLHPSVHWVDSDFAVYSLWAAHQGEGCLSAVDPLTAESALIFRSGLDVYTLAVTAAEVTFLRALTEGKSLPRAVDVASAASSHAITTFDLTTTLAKLLRWQLVTHITFEEAPHEAHC